MRNQMEEICTNCGYANSATYKSVSPSQVNKVLENSTTGGIENCVLQEDAATASGKENTENNDDQLGHYSVINTTSPVAFVGVK